MHCYPALKSPQCQIQFLLHCTPVRPALNFVMKGSLAQAFQGKPREISFLKGINERKKKKKGKKIILFWGQWWNLRQFRKRGAKKISLLTHPVHCCILALMMSPLNEFCHFKVGPAFQQMYIAMNPLQSVELWHLQQLKLGPSKLLLFFCLYHCFPLFSCLWKHCKIIFFFIAFN